MKNFLSLFFLILSYGFIVHADNSAAIMPTPSVALTNTFVIPDCGIALPDPRCKVCSTTGVYPIPGPQPGGVCMNLVMCISAGCNLADPTQTINQAIYLDITGTN